MLRVYVALVLAFNLLAGAQGYRGLALYTPYPAQSVGTEDAVTLPITVKGFGVNPQTVNVRVAETALGWKASLLGSGRGVSAVYILLDGEQNLTLRLEPPPGTKPGTYRFRLVAEGQNTRAELPVALTVGQVLPRRLSLQTDLPTLKGPPSASFRYPVILKNESDQDLLVN
ncbi:MAG: ABC transporter substrate-binding protein, partial [Meiothermus sp.]